MATLRFEDFQLREGHWVIADLRRKGGHIRTIPVPEWVKAAVDMAFSTEQLLALFCCQPVPYTYPQAPSSFNAP